MVSKWLAALSLATTLCVSSLAFSEESTTVSVGEVSAPQQEDAAKTIKSTLTEELAKVKVPAGKKFIVSANLVKLETTKNGADSTTQAVVSLAIRDAKSGAIRGVINGTGLVKAKTGDATAATLVVETAVRGATRNLNTVLAQ